MNEKFFDLKKEKQDRMINAALKIFATAGYAHASTDDIVREAGVSKGLLFHYFTSKLGLYTFLYDYATKFEQLELSSCLGKRIGAAADAAAEEAMADYFELRAQILKAQTNCMRSYPYLPLFLDRADREEDEEAAKATGAKIIAHAEQTKALFARVDPAPFRPEADAAMVGKMLAGTFRLILGDVLRMEEKAPEEYGKACEEYLAMMRALCYRETADAEIANEEEVAE